MDTETVRDQLYQLSVPRSMGPDGIHPRALKEVADVMAGPFLIICQKVCPVNVGKSLLAGSWPVLLQSIKRA